MTNDRDRPAAASTRRIKRRADALLLRRGVPRRRAKPLLEFDALAAYFGLLIGIALGAALPAAAPIVANAAIQLCVVGALEVGRDGIAECLPAP